jgi:hypothetical protein
MGMTPCFNVLPSRRNQIVQEARTNPVGFTYHTLCEYAQHSFWAAITVSRQIRFQLLEESARIRLMLCLFLKMPSKHLRK